ncbi:B12-binding domain-containing radical SAM protein [Tenacibaculum halocynthiae]|uniref:B12-binding domain-containing radical SAM protein n=1 Tax=Tenacibaculum halocynthiae TaxID=1254437 RepID=UPI003D647A45
MAKLLFSQNMDYEFVGPMYISSMVKKHGHECDLEIGHELIYFEEVIQKINPDIIGFSIMSGSHNWGRKIAKEFKKKYNITTLFRGAHPTFSPEFIKEKSVDYLIRGQGEEFVLDILNAIDKNKCFKSSPNLSYIDNDGKTKHNSLRNLHKNMDEYPYPDRELYHTLDKTQHRKSKKYNYVKRLSFSLFLLF